MSIQSKIKVYGKYRKLTKYIANLDKWLKGKELEFYPFKSATFYDQLEAVVGYDKDHTIHIIIPREVFEKVEEKETKIEDNFNRPDNGSLGDNFRRGKFKKSNQSYKAYQAGIDYCLDEVVKARDKVKIWLDQNNRDDGVAMFKQITESLIDFDRKIAKLINRKETRKKTLSIGNVEKEDFVSWKDFL